MCALKLGRLRRHGGADTGHLSRMRPAAAAHPIAGLPLLSARARHPAGLPGPGPTEDAGFGKDDYSITGPKVNEAQGVPH